ncbi:MAG: type IX secretion system outer membrane channel protein PorV [Bacteroidales bacterium]|nr:type IX secretion system outer membrane channel protein PorV [Bacteroidales bacterium]
MLKKIFLCVTLIALCSQFNFAQVINNGKYDYLGRGYLNTITTAVPFLLIAPDSRAGAMGDMGCATSADVNSQHHNPSKYVFNKNKFGISVSYSPWLRKLVDDINLAYLSAYYKVTDYDAISFSLRYFSLGDIEFTDDYGQSMGSQRPNEFAIDLGYSRKLTDEFSIAITPRFIYSNLTAGQYVQGVESQAGLAGAADLSLFYEKDLRTKALANSTIRFGVNISNMGNKISYSSGTLRRDFLPMNLKIGLGYTMEFDQYNKLSLIGEVNKLLVPTPPVYETDSNNRILYDAANNPIIAYGKNPDVSVFMGMIQSFYDAPGGFKEEMREIAWAVGLEYSYRNLFFARAGYFNESKYKGNRQYFTIGAGISYNIFTLDVAYLFTTNQHHPLENTLRFTLTFDFASFSKSEIKKQNKL